MEIPASFEQKPKGMTPEECRAQAEVYIAKNGMCLFLMDLIGSSNGTNYPELWSDYHELLDQLNTAFEQYLPVNELTAKGRTEKGFNIIFGDGATGAINTGSVIPLITDFAAVHYPKVPLRYGVAEDGWDEEGISLVK